MNTDRRKLLVLDLDETMVFATKDELPGVHEDGRFEDYIIYKRPYLNEFLHAVSKVFRLAVWSSAGDVYVSEVVKAITPEGVQFDFVWGRSKCSRRHNRAFDEYYWEKRVEKFVKHGFGLEGIIIVDDTREKTAANYGNAIYISEYSGDPQDRELMQLLRYLTALNNVENVRVVEKRNWREETM
jgi:carboxy-terminal domain RNA polymerase II polypeptide A small phosphatase